MAGGSMGEQLLVSVSEKGVLTGWLVGLAHIDDRWMMEAFVSSRQGDMSLIDPPLSSRKKDNERRIPDPYTFSPAITTGKHRDLPYLADDGFNGQRWIDHWAYEYDVTVIASPPQNAKNAWQSHQKQWLASHRQIVETVFARLTQTFGLKRINAHSDWGKVTRLAAKMAAYNIGVWFNRILGRPDGAVETLIT